MRSRRTRAYCLEWLAEADPQDSAHAQATHGSGDPVQIRQVVVTILGRRSWTRFIGRRTRSTLRGWRSRTGRSSKSVTQPASVVW